MIRSFANKETEELWLTEKSQQFGAGARVAIRKIQAIDFAVRFEDLRTPPGNCLEKLRGDREGQYSIRISDQYRLCFRFDEHHAWDVEIVDYH